MNVAFRFSYLCTFILFQEKEKLKLALAMEEGKELEKLDNRFEYNDYQNKQSNQYNDFDSHRVYSFDSREDEIEGNMDDNEKGLDESLKDEEEEGLDLLAKKINASYEEEDDLEDYDEKRQDKAEDKNMLNVLSNDINANHDHKMNTKAVDGSDPHRQPLNRKGNKNQGNGSVQSNVLPAFDENDNDENLYYYTEYDEDDDIKYM